MKLALLFIATLALSFAFVAGGADAHSKRQATQPTDGAVLDATPAAIALLFDKPMRVTLISLTDQEGAVYDLLRTDNMQSISEFSAQPPALPAGEYTVEWRGLAADGHPMQGTFSFEISS